MLKLGQDVPHTIENQPSENGLPGIKTVRGAKKVTNAKVTKCRTAVLIMGKKSRD